MFLVLLSSTLAETIDFSGSVIRSNSFKRKWIRINNGTANISFYGFDCKGNCSFDVSIHIVDKKVNNASDKSLSESTCCTEGDSGCDVGHINLNKHDNYALYSYKYSNKTGFVLENATNLINLDCGEGSSAKNCTNYQLYGEDCTYEVIVSNCGTEDIGLTGKITISSSHQTIDSRLLPIFVLSNIMSVILIPVLCALYWYLDKEMNVKQKFSLLISFASFVSYLLGYFFIFLVGHTIRAWSFFVCFFMAIFRGIFLGLIYASTATALRNPGGISPIYSPVFVTLFVLTSLFEVYSSINVLAFKYSWFNMGFGRVPIDFIMQILTIVLSVFNTPKSFLYYTFVLSFMLYITFTVYVSFFIDKYDHLKNFKGQFVFYLHSVLCLSLNTIFWYRTDTDFGFTPPGIDDNSLGVDVIKPIDDDSKIPSIFVKKKSNKEDSDDPFDNFIDDDDNFGDVNLKAIETSSKFD